MSTIWTVKGMCSMGELLKKQQVGNTVRQMDLRTRDFGVSTVIPAMQQCNALGCTTQVRAGFGTGLTAGAAGILYM